MVSGTKTNSKKKVTKAAVKTSRRKAVTATRLPKAKPKVTANASVDANTIVLERLKDDMVVIPIKGLTPIVPHAWGHKVDDLPGHPNASSIKKKRGKRDPVKEAENSTYRLDDGQPGMPAVAFKAAIVGACRFFDKPTMVEAKPLLYIIGEGKENLVRIACTIEEQPWESVVRLANGSADLRYRYRLFDWSALLAIQYTSSRIARESVIALVDAAGRLGVGDWRPSAPKSCTGTYGTWRIDETKEIGDHEVS